jgi:hypothetical protein
VLREVSSHYIVVSLITSFLPGTGCPKVINLTVSGELVEGNVLKGVPEIAWCGGTPGKGVARFVYLFTLQTCFIFICSNELCEMRLVLFIFSCIRNSVDLLNLFWNLVG